jgi:hypothetical protein
MGLDDAACRPKTNGEYFTHLIMPAKTKANRAAEQQEVNVGDTVSGRQWWQHITITGKGLHAGW